MAAVLFRSLATQIVQTTHLFLSFLSPEASLIFATLELNQETSSDPNICELEKSTVATLVLQGCGTTRFNKFVQSGEPVDLEAALCFFEQALRLLPPGQQLYHTSVSNYASALILRFEQTTTDSADLDLGIKQLQDWLSAQPQSDPTSRRLVLVTLARVQDLRWKTFRESMDLESMIESERQILKLWPPGDAERGRSSARLVAALAQRAQKASQDNTTVAKVSTNKVESVGAQILPDSDQTSKECEVVEKTVTIPPVETSTTPVLPPIPTPNNAAPVCAPRPVEKPSNSAWKGKGRQPSTDTDMNPTAPYSYTPAPVCMLRPAEQAPSGAWKGKGRQLSTDSDLYPTPTSPSLFATIRPADDDDDDSEEASIALAKSLMEGEAEGMAKEQISTKVMPLLAMGFGPDQVMSALVAAGFVYELALEYCVGGIPEELKEETAAMMARLEEKAGVVSQLQAYTTRA